MENKQIRYVSFWARLLASFVDSILATILVFAIIFFVYGMGEVQAFGKNIPMLSGFIINCIVPAVVLMIFWIARSASPGKVLVGAKIIDEKTQGTPRVGQLVGRYFAYYLSLIPFGLGFFLMLWDPKRQGWHDKLSGTVVIRDVRNT